ncbi:hypothetical protein D2E26_0952 [Bifidobacterium dolichotidis]|uniref:Uncharacterized protein n=1 Tax=Bifidobacterium dolichotidis TaxID=2306976 RepID=A0A430FQ00_9BIFI|nr:hypothetical protein [Bifidobacterium dolichotidis]RSX54898.1 hypothetical protein D2E26_0952 [Bifidobacterium dolichotidis]
MAAVRNIFVTVCAAIVIWIAVLLGGMTYAMFCSTDQVRRTEALGGAVYFQSDAADDGGFNISLGVGNQHAALVVLAVCAVVCAAVDLIILHVRKTRKANNEDTHNTPRAAFVPQRANGMRNINGMPGTNGVNTMNTVSCQGMPVAVPAVAHVTSPNPTGPSHKMY